MSPEVLARLPAVTIADFNNGVIRVKAGELAALRLENGDGVGHSFDIDALDVHVVMPAHADNLALFVAPTTPGEYRFYCAPHYHKSSGSGMHGTLIVEPSRSPRQIGKAAPLAAFSVRRYTPVVRECPRSQIVPPLLTVRATALRKTT